MATSPSEAVILDEQGLRLLTLLIAMLPKIKANDPRTFVSYKQVHEALKLPLLGATFGVSLQNQGLNSLADWTALTGKPGITGLIIDKEKLTPGPGYYRLFGRNQDDINWWLAEIQKSKVFDWEPYQTSHEMQPEDVSGGGWSRDELRASVEAYLDMQRLDRAGTPFIKKKYYDELASQFGRTAKSFEYRMQNISYVLSLMGRDWLSGLKPAKNVGANVATQIEELVAEIEDQVIAPTVAFEIAVREDVKRKQLPQPVGSPAPTAYTSSVTQYQRDPSVKAWVLKQAEGVCECCNQQAPFLGADGLPYLEAHHVRKLAEKGSDTTSNVVAVCPNCHRELHYGEQAKELVSKLYKSVSRLKRE
ncbi:HNH endonuclease [Oryzomicrobium sp.]|uniref:HNH endonuclease n=1 Tax=Oryzomicrobium sp. TaxID=1911578 RepID=UPI002FE4054E